MCLSINLVFIMQKSQNCLVRQITQNLKRYRVIPRKQLFCSLIIIYHSVTCPLYLISKSYLSNTYVSLNLIYQLHGKRIIFHSIILGMLLNF